MMTSLVSRKGPVLGLKGASGRVCSLDFRPSRFFGCQVEKVLAEFFSSEQPELGAMPDAFWDLTQGTVRPALDDRVVVEASFCPSEKKGDVCISLFYRLPCVESQRLDAVLGALDRRSTRSGYFRFGAGVHHALRGSTRVRTSVVGRDAGESYLVTTTLLSVRAARQLVQPRAESRDLVSVPSN